MYHEKTDYEKTDEVALRLRMDYSHFEKRLDIFQLATQLNVILIKYSSLSNNQLSKINSLKLNDGFTITRNGKSNNKIYTFYNDKIDNTRIRLTIAHEIKHVVFQEKSVNEKEEDLANHFARYILAPTCLVMPYVKNSTPYEITQDFNISYEAACNAFKTAENRIAFNKGVLSDFEKEFVYKFNEKLKQKAQTTTIV